VPTTRAGKINKTENGGVREKRVLVICGQFLLAKTREGKFLPKTLEWAEEAHLDFKKRRRQPWGGRAPGGKGLLRIWKQKTEKPFAKKKKTWKKKNCGRNEKNQNANQWRKDSKSKGRSKLVLVNTRRRRERKHLENTQHKEQFKSVSRKGLCLRDKESKLSWKTSRKKDTSWGGGERG